jgi:thymidylate synthase ThyX
MKQQITAEVIAHSRSLDCELVTFKTRFPKFILAEFNTHRMLSRNSSSTRAIPMRKQIEAVEDDMFVPTWVGKNQPGMSSAIELDSLERDKFEFSWRSGMEACADEANVLADLGFHKQHAGRMIEPWVMVDHISSGTEWGNFFDLRCNKHAQPEIQELAWKMLWALYNSKPNQLNMGEWHIPFNHPDDRLETQTLVKVAVARCARISYRNFDGKVDIQKDIELYESLLSSGHMSPFEHVAVATGDNKMYKNFRGFMQLRQSVEQEQKRFDRIEMLKLINQMPSWVSKVML